MSWVRILVDGYVKFLKCAAKPDQLIATSTTTLIEDSGFRVVIDPGMDKRRLLRALKDEGLGVEDINYVGLTHHHPDHCALSSMFTNARIVDWKWVYSWDGSMRKHTGVVPNTRIRILETLGHSFEDCSFIVRDKKLGVVAIVGDLWWWDEGSRQVTTRAELLKHPDPYSADITRLRESRKLILSIADYVIPGHGKAFSIEPNTQ